MAQQISDLVIKLDVDRATFSEQVARIKGQLTGMADESDKVQARMQRAADRQSAALKSVGDAGAAAAAEMKARQSAATEGLTKDWQSVSRSVDETHRRVTELNQRMRENDGQAAALARRQDELAASFFRQIDGVRQLNGETQSLANVQARFRAARAQGNITQQDYLALISRTTARQKELQIVEEKSAAARTRFLSQLKQQVAEQKLSGTELLRMKAAQVGASDAAEVYIRKLEAAKVATHGLGLQSAAARQELGILIGEVMRGNFGALRGSGITLANRAGWIDQLLSLRGLGIAGMVGGIATAVFGLGKAWYDGSKESEEFNRQLILTGNYAGKTSGQLQALARSLAGNGITQHAAAGVLAQVVGSGAFSGNDVSMVSNVAARLQQATGQAVDETINQFKRLKDDPVNAVSTLNDSLHFLTATQYEQIASAQALGDSQKAAELAIRVPALPMSAYSSFTSMLKPQRRGYRLISSCVLLSIFRACSCRHDRLRLSAPGVCVAGTEAGPDAITTARNTFPKTVRRPMTRRKTFVAAAGRIVRIVTARTRRCRSAVFRPLTCRGNKDA